MPGAFLPLISLTHAPRPALYLELNEVFTHTVSLPGETGEATFSPKKFLTKQTSSLYALRELGR